MPNEFVQVDAFTDRPFRGNPAAVCILNAPAEEEWMQDVAREMNLSETAFCHPSTVVAGEWELRWFTPGSEVDLCGHATLATAHVLATEHGSTDTMGFHTRSGRLSATVGENGDITLDFPVDELVPVDVTAEMGAALGVEVLAAAYGRTDLLLEAGADADVRSCIPDLGAVSALAERGVILTARNEREGFDVVSRVFAPNVAIPEDPVTGSAHTTLAVWWVPRLGIAAFRAEQASQRGGELEVELVGDRVRITGRAVTVVRGTLLP